jgi:mono/diheme cytochrome c family protein
VDQVTRSTAALSAIAVVVVVVANSYAVSGFSRTQTSVVSGFSRTVISPSQQRTIWDGVYTAEQATRGEKVYADRCARCHGDGLQGVEAAPALTGPTFYSTWEGETLGALFERMRSSMPQDSPGSLSRAQNADMLAYMLRVGGYPAGQSVLDGQAGALAQTTVLMYRP